MEKWYMVFDYQIFDRCMASSYDEASAIFKSRSRYIDWCEADILSEADYLAELELNAFENQTYEG